MKLRLLKDHVANTLSEKDKDSSLVKRIVNRLVARNGYLNIEQNTDDFFTLLQRNNVDAGLVSRLSVALSGVRKADRNRCLQPV